MEISRQRKDKRVTRDHREDPAVCIGAVQQESRQLCDFRYLVASESGNLPEGVENTGDSFR